MRRIHCACLLTQGSPVVFLLFFAALLFVQTVLCPHCFCVYSEEVVYSASPEGVTVPPYPVDVRALNWTSSDGKVSVHAIGYAPIGVSHCPVVIYSHGLGGSPEHFVYLARAWARQGIATILLRHPGSDDSQWRGYIRPLSHLQGVFDRYWSGRDRALMIRFVIDRLSEQRDESGTFASLLDLDRIGAAGNDLGALGALLVGGQIPPDGGEDLTDPRVKAVVAFSPPVYCNADRGAVVYGAVHTPFLSFGGTNDDGLVGTTKAFQRRVPFDSMSGNSRFHITLTGADHMVYGGHPCPTHTSDDAMYQVVLRNMTTLFWSSYLLNNAVARDRIENGALVLSSPIAHLERYVDSDHSDSTSDGSSVPVYRLSSLPDRKGAVPSLSLK